MLEQCQSCSISLTELRRRIHTDPESAKALPPDSEFGDAG